MKKAGDRLFLAGVVWCCFILLSLLLMTFVPWRETLIGGPLFRSVLEQKGWRVSAVHDGGAITEIVPLSAELLTPDVDTQAVGESAYQRAAQNYYKLLRIGGFAGAVPGMFAMFLGTYLSVRAERKL